MLQKGKRYLIARADEFGFHYATKVGHTGHLILSLAEFKYIDSGMLMFDMGEPMLNGFDLTDDKGIIKHQDVKYVLLDVVNLRQ